MVMVANIDEVWYNVSMVLLDGPIPTFTEQPSTPDLSMSGQSYDGFEAPELTLVTDNTLSGRLARAANGRVESSHGDYNTTKEPVSDLWTTELFTETASYLEDGTSNEIEDVKSHFDSISRVAALLVSQYPRPSQMSPEQFEAITARRDAARLASIAIYKQFPEPVTMRSREEVLAEKGKTIQTEISEVA